MRKVRLNRRDFSIIQLAFLATVASVGGWLVFEGLTKILSLDSIKPGWMIVLGLGVTWALYEFGISRKIR